MLGRRSWERLQKHVKGSEKHVKSDNFKIQSCRTLEEDCAQTLGNRACQYLAAVFRTPDEVIRQRRNSAAKMAVAFSTHVLNYATPLDSCQQTKAGARASSAWLKPAVSAAIFYELLV